MEHMNHDDAMTGATLHKASTVTKEEAQHLTVGIAGMTCDHCANTVAKALIAVDGVFGVKVFLSENKAMIGADPAADVTVEKLAAAVAATDYKVTGVL